MIEQINEWNWINFQRWLTWAQIWLAGAANMGLTRAKQPLTLHSTLALFCLIECQFSCSFLKQEVHNYNFSGVFPVCLSVRGRAFWSMSLQARNVGQIPPPNKPNPPKTRCPAPHRHFQSPPKGYRPKQRIVIDLTPCKAGRRTVDSVQRERWMHETE